MKCKYCCDPKRLFEQNCQSNDTKSDCMIIQSCYGKHSHQTTAINNQNLIKYQKLHPQEFNEFNDNTNDSKQIILEEDTVKFEYSLIRFLANNKYGINFSDELIDFLHANLKDSEIINKTIMYR